MIKTLDLLAPLIQVITARKIYKEKKKQNVKRRTYF